MNRLVIAVICLFLSLTIVLGVKSVEYGLFKDNITKKTLDTENEIILDVDSINQFLKHKKFDRLFTKLNKWCEDKDNRSKQAIYLSMFDRLAGQGDYLEALYFLRKAEITILNSGHGLIGDVYFRLGELLNLKDHPRRALMYYEKALIAFESHPEKNSPVLIQKQEMVLIAMARSSYSLGKMKSALKWADEAVELTRSANSYLLLSELWLQDKQTTKVKLNLRRLESYELDASQKIEYRQLKADLLLLEHKYEGAKNVLENLIIEYKAELDQQIVQLRELYYKLSHIERTLGEIEKGESYFKYYEHVNDTIELSLAKISTSVLAPLTMVDKRDVAWGKYLVVSVIVSYGCFLFFYWIKYDSKLSLKRELITCNSQDFNSPDSTIESIEKNLVDPLNNLMHLARSNDPGFLTLFYEVYPDVFNKLISLKPKLVQTELSFLAMVWLNFSTKDIASFTSVQPKTVQMKKHRLRKKLKIESDEDLYVWLKKL